MSQQTQEIGLMNILVEGSKINGSFLDEGLIDKFFSFFLQNGWVIRKLLESLAGEE
jgi:hypothetical protein